MHDPEILPDVIQTWILYSHTHWQLLLLHIHLYGIVWYIFQMALFLFCLIISYVVKTNLWYQDLVKTLRPKLEISKFVHFVKNFKNNYHRFKVEFFSNFWHFFDVFWLFVTCKYNREKTCWFTKVLQSHILAILTVSR